MDDCLLAEENRKFGKQERERENEYIWISAGDILEIVWMGWTCVYGQWCARIRF